MCCCSFMFSIQSHKLKITALAQHCFDPYVENNLRPGLVLTSVASLGGFLPICFQFNWMGELSSGSLLLVCTICLVRLYSHKSALPLIISSMIETDGALSSARHEMTDDRWPMTSKPSVIRVHDNKSCVFPVIILHRVLLLCDKDWKCFIKH